MQEKSRIKRFYFIRCANGSSFILRVTATRIARPATISYDNNVPNTRQNYYQTKNTNKVKILANEHTYNQDATHMPHRT